MTWIAYKDRVYRLTAVTMGTGKNYLGRAQNTARSFRPLTREECASIQQSYLRLVTARGGENLSELGERSGNAWTPVYTGVINDLRPGAGLEEGRLVKIAVPEPYRSRNGCRP